MKGNCGWSQEVSGEAESQVQSVSDGRGRPAELHTHRACVWVPAYTWMGIEEQGALNRAQPR